MARSARFSKKRSCPRTSASIGCDLWDAVLGLVSGSSGKAGQGLSERQGLAGRGHLLRRGSQRQGCWIAYLSGSKASSRQGRKSILGEVWTLGPPLPKPGTKTRANPRTSSAAKRINLAQAK